MRDHNKISAEAFFIALGVLLSGAGLVVGIIGMLYTAYVKPLIITSNWDIELEYSLCISKRMIPVQDVINLSISCAPIQYGDEK